MNVDVIVLPGPSSIISSLIGSGIDPLPFTFLGFLRKKLSEKTILNILNQEFTQIFFESPHRINSTINIIKTLCKANELNVNIAIIKDLTKDFEWWYRGSVEKCELENTNGKGEFVIITKRIF